MTGRVRRAGCGLLGVWLASAGAGRAQEHREVVGLLELFVETHGVSEREDAVREEVRRALPPWANPVVDEKGNLTVTLGSGEPHVVFVAHMDEVGFLVESLREDGCAVLRGRGGFWPSLFEAEPARVHSRRGRRAAVPAVFEPRAGYWGASERAPPLPLTVCFGTRSREETEALGVAVGDPVTMPKGFERLGPHRATGRSFDDRVGTVAQLLAIRRLRPDGVKGTVTFAWVVEEEIGLFGAQHLARRVRGVKRVYAVDTFVSSDSPLESKRYAFARLGQGAVLRAVDRSNVVPTRDVERVRRIATGAGIPLQIGATGGGNDGAAFLAYGAVDVPIAWPLRYSHSPAEVIDLRDVEALASLIHALALAP